MTDDITQMPSKFLLSAQGPMETLPQRLAHALVDLYACVTDTPDIKALVDTRLAQLGLQMSIPADQGDEKPSKLILDA